MLSVTTDAKPEKQSIKSTNCITMKNDKLPSTVYTITFVVCGLLFFLRQNEILRCSLVLIYLNNDNKRNSEKKPHICIKVTVQFKSFQV